jgi:hypothetical protein
MIDKLDQGVPRNAEYTRSFGKLIELSMSPEWHRKVWRDGGHYLRRGDFREISGGELPVIVHQYNRHDKKAGDKIELVETGGRSLLEMNSAVSAIYAVDPLENRIMRLDCAADLPGVPVDWFRNNTEFRGKQTNREWAVQSITQRTAQTLYSGVKPHQLRIYDKTGHRIKLLESENRRRDKDQEPEPQTFEARWGYPPSQIVTRVERQLGGAEVKKFGYAKVGHLYELAGADPFRQIVFPSDLDFRGVAGASVFVGAGFTLSTEDRIGIRWMRDRVERDGVVNAKAMLRSLCSSRDAYYRRWSKWKEFVLPNREAQVVTRTELLDSFRASTLNQITLRAA